MPTTDRQLLWLCVETPEWFIWYPAFPTSIICVVRMRPGTAPTGPASEYVEVRYPPTSTKMGAGATVIRGELAMQALVSLGIIDP